MSVEDNMTIIHKYLEKGHTQMEADHRKEGTQTNHLLATAIGVLYQSARPIPRPYEVKYVYHEFFKDYSKFKYYMSIRPGTKAGDPVVTDLRVLKYNPGKDGRIEYKLAFNDDFQEFQRRAYAQTPSGEVAKKAHSGALPIKTSKYQYDSKIPNDYLSFYDNLLH